MKIFHCVTFLVWSLLCAHTVSATEVSVAGFAFAGDFSTAAQRFPYTHKLFMERQATGNAADTFSYLVIDKTRNVKNSTFEFTPGGMVHMKSDRALMAVLMLTGETVAVENYGEYHKTFVNLRGDALIFDYKSQTIVRSCPVNVILFDATPQRPAEARVSQFVDELIRRDDAKGLITQFVHCLSEATLPKEGTRTVQVRKGEISPEALAFFPEPLRNNPAAASAMLAGSLSSVLSTRLGISMLPDSIGHAVGGVMSMRLENGADIKLKLGEGDYVFDVKLNKFAKIKTAQTNVSATYVYGAYMSMRFVEPQLNTVYIDTDLKNGEVGVLPAGQINNDDFAAYQDAMRGLFTKFADALQQPGSKWIATSASVKPIEGQLSLAREILRK